MSSQSQPQESLSPAIRWDWLAALVLLLANQIVAARLVATDWVKDLEIVLVLALLGSILGLALGISHFSISRVILLVSLYSVFVLPWQLGLILGPGIPWLERLASLSGRLGIVFQQLAGDQNVTDPILFLLIAALLTWVLCIYAGFVIIRQGHPWQAIMPGGIAIMMINIYSYQDDLNARFLAIYIFAALLLIARIHLINRQTHWQEKHIPVALYISFDIILGTIVAAGLAITMAWKLPAITESLKPARESWEKVVAPWDSVSEQLSHVFAALKSSVGLVTVGGIKGYYGDELPMGLGIPLTDDLIFSVEAPSLPDTGMRYYWRARHYEIYENGLWRNDKVKTKYVTPDQFDVSIPVYDDRWETKVKITTLFPISTLYTPSQPYWTSRPVDLETTAVSDDEVEIAAIHASSSIMPGEIYEVRASLSDTSVQDLRSAGTDYPSWVTDKYLQLPASITPRTLALAEEITGDLDNPYDQVQAITAYLRTHITYVDQIPKPPEDQEPLDWFLFDHQEGFCNYYATAEVLLARALGIPARLVAGYAQGENQREAASRPALGQNIDELPGDIVAESDSEAIYHVLAKNAHTWPEIYFPGLGWVEFEPTVNQTALLRRENDESADQRAGLQPERPEMEDEFALDDFPTPDDEQNLPEDLSLNNDEYRNSIAKWMNIALVLGLLILFWKMLRRFRGFPPLPAFVEMRLLRAGFQPPLVLRKWARWSALSSLERSFHEINRALRRLGQPPFPSDTPAERAAALSRKLPESADSVQILLQEYQTTIYRKQVSNVKLARSVAQRIKRQSYKARIMKIWEKNSADHDAANEAH